MIACALLAAVTVYYLQYSFPIKYDLNEIESGTLYLIL